jgi:hypothetical protein
MTVAQTVHPSPEAFLAMRQGTLGSQPFSVLIGASTQGSIAELPKPSKK